MQTKNETEKGPKKASSFASSSCNGNPAASMAPDEIVIYKRRWFVLAVVCLMNFTNHLTWMTFAPVSSYTVEFYGRSNAPTLLFIVYMIFSPLGFLAMRIIGGREGLRNGCLLGAWLNFTGNIFRLFAACFDWLPTGGLVAFSTDFRFAITLLGQCISACALPFGMYLPTKVAQVWFPDSQRVIANAMCTQANPLGAAAMFVLSPLIVNQQRPGAFSLLTALVTIPAMICALLSLGICSSRPPTPPSYSAEALENKSEKHKRHQDQAATFDDSEGKLHPSQWGVLRQICAVLQSRNFVVLALSLGAGFGQANAWNNMIQPIFCSKGYSNEFAGFIGSMTIVSGLIVSPFLSMLVDRSRRFEEFTKFCMCCNAIAASLFHILLQFRSMEPFILAIFIFFGAITLPIFPICLELGVEITYPYSPSISTGLMLMTGQTLGVLYIMLTTALARSPTATILRDQQCISGGRTMGVYDWTYSLILWNILAVARALFFTTCFWPKYRRIEYERSEHLLRQKIKNRSDQELVLLPEMDERMEEGSDFEKGTLTNKEKSVVVSFADDRKTVSEKEIQEPMFDTKHIDSDVLDFSAATYAEPKCDSAAMIVVDDSLEKIVQRLVVGSKQMAPK